MSYLGIPRLHFAGEFTANPSTSNNIASNYPGSVTIPTGPRSGNWNPGGAHLFGLRGCIVQSVVDSRGQVTVAAQDSLIGGRVEVSGRDGRLVDLDPSHQTSSQIWGMSIRIADTGSSSVTGVMSTGTLRQLWFNRSDAGDPAASVGDVDLSQAGGCYQTVLTNLAWTPSGTLGSPLLQALRIASPNRLSIRFVVYAYHSVAGANFTVGRIVGTVGPSPASEPETFTIGRIARGTPDPAGGPAFGDVTFVLDRARSRLVLDLGNAIPELLPDGDRRPLGAVRAFVIPSTPGHIPQPLGTIAVDKAHYRTTAGVEEVPLTAEQVTMVGVRPILIRAAGPPAKVIASEDDSRRRIEVDQTVLRLNPGESATLRFVGTIFGQPTPGMMIGLAITRGAPATAVTAFKGSAFATPVTLPGSVLTGPNGVTEVRITGGDPGTPRPDIDGQLFELAYFDRDPIAANRVGGVAIRLFSRHGVPANPTHADVRDILQQYARLYPSMRAVIDLTNLTQVRATAAALALAMRRPVTDAGFMPVTRDLSRDKTQLLLRWLDAGAPS